MPEVSPLPPSLSRRLSPAVRGGASNSPRRSPSHIQHAVTSNCKGPPHKGAISSAAYLQRKAHSYPTRTPSPTYDVQAGDHPPFTQIPSPEIWRFKRRPSSELEGWNVHGVSPTPESHPLRKSPNDQNDSSSASITVIDPVHTIDSDIDFSAGGSRVKRRKRRAAAISPSQDSDDQPVVLATVAAKHHRAEASTSRKARHNSPGESGDSDQPVFLDTVAASTHRRRKPVATHKPLPPAENDSSDGVEVLDRRHKRAKGPATRALDEDLAKLRAEVLRKKAKIAGLGKLRRARDEAAAAAGAPTGSKTGGRASPSASVDKVFPSSEEGNTSRRRIYTAKKSFTRVKPPPDSSRE